MRPPDKHSLMSFTAALGSRPGFESSGSHLQIDLRQLLFLAISSSQNLGLLNLLSQRLGRGPACIPVPPPTAVRPGENCWASLGLVPSFVKWGRRPRLHK